jgi:hypothetical protein
VVGGIATTHHSRNAQLTRNDGGVAGAATPVGHDGAGALHHRLPVGVGHVRDEDVTGLYLVHFRNVVYQTHRTGTDFLADGTALRQHCAFAFELVAVLHLVAGLTLHGFGAGLQDVEQAVGTVFAPLNVHGSAIVLLDHQGVMRQLLDIGIAQAEAVALLHGHVHGFDQFAALRFFFGRAERHLDEFAAQVAADGGALACFQHGLVHVELVRVDGTLHHGFTQAVAAGDEHHVFKTAFGVDGEHHTGCAQVGAHHALHAGTQGHVGMGKALVHAVADGSVVVEAGKHLFHLVQHFFNAHHVQKRFLLASKRGVGQVFGSG